MAKKILVVDDENDIVEMTVKRLQRDGYDVIGFNKVRDVLEYFKNQTVDLMITDIRMPEMHGTDLFFELRKIDPFLQVIFVTAYPSLENMTQALETGSADFIIKPFEMDNLKAIVREAFEKIERWRGLRQELLKNRGQAKK